MRERRFDPEVWSGIAMLAVVLIAAGPVLLGWTPTMMPHLAWVALFAVFLALLVATFWRLEGGPWELGVFGLLVLSSWGLVIGAGAEGLVAILLVVTVGAVPYFLPVRAGVVLIALNLGALGSSFFLRPRGLGPDGWATELAVLLGFYLLIQAATLMSSVALLREQRSKRQLAAANVELQATSALLADATRTAERLRISRELHDLIGHQLTVLTLELEAAKHRDPREAGAHIEQAERVARALLGDVRATVGRLRAEAGDLREALERVVAPVREPRIALDVDEELSLDEERTTLLVRAVQELVTNAIKHSRADELWIEVRSTSAGVLLRARDDGRGKRDLVPGNGLSGLRERFESMGGSATFDGSRGFSVTARIPSA